MEIHWHSEIPSTNQEARTLARMGAAHGTIVGADYQSAGRGRANKAWQCLPNDGLLCSILLRPLWPKEYWAWTALLAGLVIADQLERDCLYPQIKWPNDILVNGKKIAGILTEAGSNWVVVGIGMNLNMKTVPEVEGGLPPTSFYLETDCQLDARALAERFRDSLLELLKMERPTSLIKEVEKRLAWLNQPIEFTHQGTTTQGKIEGIAKQGQLRARTVQGNSIELVDAGAVRPLS